jgi:hypothetical protein
MLFPLFFIFSFATGRNFYILTINFATFKINMYILYKESATKVRDSG